MALSLVLTPGWCGATAQSNQRPEAANDLVPPHQVARQGGGNVYFPGPLPGPFRDTIFRGSFQCQHMTESAHEADSG